MTPPECEVCGGAIRHGKCTNCYAVDHHAAPNVVPNVAPLPPRPVLTPDEEAARKDAMAALKTLFAKAEARVLALRPRSPFASRDELGNSTLDPSERADRARQMLQRYRDWCRQHGLA